MRSYTRVITTEWTESVPRNARYELESGERERASQLMHGDALRGGAVVLSVEPASIGTPRYRPKPALPGAAGGTGRQSSFDPDAGSRGAYLPD